MCGAVIEDQPPVAGAIPKPEGQTETAATQAFLNSMAAIIAWGAQGWRIAGLAKAECPGGSAPAPGG